jgi:hypothetical protein
VLSAATGPTRDLVVTFDDGSTFETLVDEITGDGEQWRLLNRTTGAHVVASSDGFRIDG